MQQIPLNILDETKKTITQYGLLKESEDIIVAFSGGKDSLFTMLTLKELGYSIVPVTVDMGYEKNFDWGKKVATKARDLGFKKAKALYARNNKTLCNVTPHALNKIKINLNALDDPETLTNKNITPCTACYNAKTILLESFAIEEGIGKVVFGQHALDAIASMLKAAFMYIDRWDNKNERFSHAHFSDLVNNIIPQLTQDPEKALKSPILDRTASLCSKLLATTDDPPQQILQTNSGKNIKLIRPLFTVRESAIRKFITNHSIPTEGCGCRQETTNGFQTPREMIYYRMLRLIDESHGGDIIIQRLMELVSLGLSNRGELAVNTRNLRSKLLGPQYKNTVICSSKKV